MSYSLSHTDSEVEALVQKLIDEDKSRQNAILDLALQFEKSCNAKDDLKKDYEKCNDISQESRALINTFLKEGSDKDYELNLSMYGKTDKLEKQMDAKLAWLLEKYYYRSQESVWRSSSHADLYLTEKELHQLHLDEEALRVTLEEKAIYEKAREEKIRQKQANDDEFFWNLDKYCLAIEGENVREVPKKQSTVAVKRIFDTEDESGEQGFFAEIEMLTSLHRDIKSANIMLDGHLDAIIGEFGLCKFLYSGNEEHNKHCSRQIAGTKVYMDPQYTKEGKLKKESHVYCLGVVMSEILRGRLAYDTIYNSHNSKGLALTARWHVENKTAQEIIDPRMKEGITEAILPSI
nr:protein kinase-like domain, phloem protein 2-like protein [Tanacetum cinerariifolium]